MVRSPLTIGLLMAGIAFAAADQWSDRSYGATPSGVRGGKQQPPTLVDADQTTVDQRGTDALPLAVKVLPSAKTDAEVIQEREDRDQKSANERALVVFNGLLTLFNALLVAVTLGLVVYTRKLWSATDNLVRGAEDAAQRQLRAYVSGSPDFIVAFDEKRCPGIRFTLNNSGVTPARQLRNRGAIEVLPHPPEPGMSLPPLTNAFSPPLVLFPSSKLFGHSARSEPFDKETIAKIRKGEVRMYAYGEIQYLDGFHPEPRTTTFCSTIVADAPTLKKITSSYKPEDLKVSFEIAPMGNDAS